MGGLTCKRAEAMIDDLLDDLLPEPERETLVAHLEECESCQSYRDAARFTLDMLGSQPLASPTPRSLDRMWSNLESKLDDHTTKPVVPLEGNGWSRRRLIAVGRRPK